MAATTQDTPGGMEPNENTISRWNILARVHRTVRTFYDENRTYINNSVKAIFVVAYFSYFGYALYYRFGDEGSIRLLAGTVFVVFVLLRRRLNRCTDPIVQGLKRLLNILNGKSKRKIMKWILYLISTGVVITLMVLEIVIPMPQNLLCLLGLAAFIVVCFLTSTQPSKIDWHPVFWGLNLQFYLAVLILRTQWGYDTFDWMGERIKEFLGYAHAGTVFVFDDPYSHFFAFSVMPVITFFSAVVSILNYLGITQIVISVLGRFLSVCLGTSPAESMNAGANIFLSMLEGPIFLQSFLPDMTLSELHAILTGGFATIAGGVMAVYISFGVPANHLLSASVMSAPAALAVSKLMCPETTRSKSSQYHFSVDNRRTTNNIIEAATEGAVLSIKLISGIIANIIAFLALLAFVNANLTWIGNRVGIEKLSFELICSYLLYPVALFMGTKTFDCRRMAGLVGVKTFTNEFIAYQRLQTLMMNRHRWENYTLHYNDTSANWHWDGQDVVLERTGEILHNGFLSLRSEVIGTYALCGFSNIGAIAIMLGGMAALAPTRKSDLSRVMVRAMIAGNIACFMTASIAGMFVEEGVI